MPEEIELNNPCEGCINKPEEVLMLRFCNKMCDKYQQYQSDKEAFNKLKERHKEETEAHAKQVEITIKDLHRQLKEQEAEISQLKADKKQDIEYFISIRKLIKKTRQDHLKDKPTDEQGKLILNSQLRVLQDVINYLKQREALK